MKNWSFCRRISWTLRYVHLKSVLECLVAFEHGVTECIFTITLLEDAEDQIGYAVRVWVQYQWKIMWNGVTLTNRRLVLSLIKATSETRFQGRCRNVFGALPPYRKPQNSPPDTARVQWCSSNVSGHSGTFRKNVFWTAETMLTESTMPFSAGSLAPRGSERPIECLYGSPPMNVRRACFRV